MLNPPNNPDTANTMKGLNPSAMVATDLDGTLLNSEGTLSPTNHKTMQALASSNILCVVATGRSLWSVKNVVDPNTPFDYLVFSSGSGITNWPEGALLHSQHLSRIQALHAASVLRDHACDFMLHESVPDNHHFWYHQKNPDNPDFVRRLKRYRPYCKPWPDSGLSGDAFSQLLVIQHPDHPRVSQSQLATALAPLNVIRTTSPLDHVSIWFEIFPPQVSKACGVQWLANRYNLNSESVLVIGNDYNDLQMLEWTEHAVVVANAPVALCQRFKTVPGNDEDGFSVAVRNWLLTRK